MKNVFEHIEYVKGQPHHIRKRVAFSAAVGVTAVIAIIWLTSSLATGAFAIRGNSFDEQTPAVPNGATNTNTNLAGAAAALPPSSANVPAHIEIIDTGSSASGQKKAEQTIVPF